MYQQNPGGSHVANGLTGAQIRNDLIHIDNRAPMLAQERRMQLEQRKSNAELQKMPSDQLRTLLDQLRLLNEEYVDAGRLYAREIQRAHRDNGLLELKVQENLTKLTEAEAKSNAIMAEYENKCILITERVNYENSTMMEIQQFLEQLKESEETLNREDASVAETQLMLSCRRKHVLLLESLLNMVKTGKVTIKRILPKNPPTAAPVSATVPAPEANQPSTVTATEAPLNTDTVAAAVEPNVSQENKAKVPVVGEPVAAPLNTTLANFAKEYDMLKGGQLSEVTEYVEEEKTYDLSTLSEAELIQLFQDQYKDEREVIERTMYKNRQILDAKLHIIQQKTMEVNALTMEYDKTTLDYHDLRSQILQQKATVQDQESEMQRFRTENGLLSLAGTNHEVRMAQAMLKLELYEEVLSLAQQRARVSGESLRDVTNEVRVLKQSTALLQAAHSDQIKILSEAAGLQAAVQAEIDETAAAAKDAEAEISGYLNAAMTAGLELEKEEKENVRLRALLVAETKRIDALEAQAVSEEEAVLNERKDIASSDKDLAAWMKNGSSTTTKITKSSKKRKKPDE